MLIQLSKEQKKILNENEEWDKMLHKLLLAWKFFVSYVGELNTLRISIMISLGSREEVVFILHVKRRDRGFTWSSFTLLL